MATDVEVRAAQETLNDLLRDRGEANPVTEDILKRVLEAAEKVRPPIIFETLDGSHRCTVRGASDIVVEKLR